MDHSSYQKWRKVKLKSYPQGTDELFVEIGGLVDLSFAKKSSNHGNLQAFQHGH